MSELKYIRLAKTKPCTDCGISYPYYVMQFDHRNKADKSFNLACRSGSNKGYQAIIAEIAKCDVVCANCHAIRTYVQNIKKE